MPRSQTITRAESMRRRLATARAKKLERAWQFFLRVIARRKLPVALGPGHVCFYGQHQLVAEVKTVAGRTLYKSVACSGCPIGARVIAQYAEDRALPKESATCDFLKKHWLMADGPEHHVGDVRVANLY